MTFTDFQKRSIFKALASKSQFQVGLDFGINKEYESNTSVVNVVNKIYHEVKENPERFTVTPDVVELVEKGMDSRKGTRSAIRRVELENPEFDERSLVVGAGKKAWILINQKLDYLAKNKKAFRNESIMNLAKVAGIVFDKSQIVKGEATEHIALKAKIDQNITPEEALGLIMKFREGQSADTDD